MRNNKIRYKRVKYGNKILELEGKELRVTEFIHLDKETIPVTYSFEIERELLVKHKYRVENIAREKMVLVR